MENLLVLGTGGGITKNCYSTCFLLQNDNQYLLVDTGSGNQILNQIDQMKIDMKQIHDVFISHEHIDHLLGIFPFVRANCQSGNAKLNIYCSPKTKKVIETFILQTFHEVHIKKYNENVMFHELCHEQLLDIIGYKIKVLDLYSKEGVQYGFQTMLQNGKCFTFLGDVPCCDKLYDTIKDTTWVCHEVFCREEEKEKFKPHEKNHSTIKDVCQVMQRLNVKNLVMWHTKDNDIENRKKLYQQEAKLYFDGMVYVPNDLEVIKL